MFKDVRQGANKALGKNSWMLQAFLMILVIVVAVKIFKSLKSGAGAVGQALGNESISIQTGISTNRIIYVRQLANALWDKGVTTYAWLLRDYDEQMFIDSINKMTTPKEVALLDQFFQEKSGTSLQKVIDDSFTSSDKSKVNKNWLAVIQS